MKDPLILGNHICVENLPIGFSLCLASHLRLGHDLRILNDQIFERIIPDVLSFVCADLALGHLLVLFGYQTLYLIVN